MSQIKIPLIPFDCMYCQYAYQVDIQLLDEQIFFGNRTIQRIKIFLKNFEIEDSSYICLQTICPIIVEYGSDTIVLNITSSLFSHVFLSMIYVNSHNNSILCSIQTRFGIFSLNNSLTCTDKIYLHPRFDIQLVGQLKFNDCRAYLFDKSFYEKSIKFDRQEFLTNNQITKIKSSINTCEYILENIISINNVSLIQTNQIITTIRLYSYYNPWKKDIQLLGTCQTKVIPYHEMYFTNDIIHIRNIIIEPGQTIQVQCPIDGSKEYLKYVWYYQRYQPKYQLSNNRTILLTNITEQMQGKYMCIGDDGNEKLEFEMTLNIFNPNKKTTNSFQFIILILIVIGCLILLCLIICFILKKFSSSTNIIEKQNSLMIHHDVLLRIQHSSNQQSLWNQAPYHTLDYIDEQPINHILSTTTNESIQNPWKRQRNLYGQSSTDLSHNLPLIISNSDKTLPFLVKFQQISHSINNCINEQHSDVEILKISVPSLNQSPLVKATDSITSFDSQNELEEFHQMTSISF